MHKYAYVHANAHTQKTFRYLSIFLYFLLCGNKSLSCKDVHICVCNCVFKKTIVNINIFMHIHI